MNKPITIQEVMTARGMGLIPPPSKEYVDPRVQRAVAKLDALRKLMDEQDDTLRKIAEGF